MSTNLKAEIKSIVISSLDRAESVWDESAHLIKAEAAYDALNEGLESRAIASNIPGHPFLFTGKSDVSEFIAFVVDIRKSTEHLKTYHKEYKVNLLQRVYFETSALLPALAAAIRHEGGQVTEYLGDGVLALFKVDEAKKSKALYATRHAAINCMTIARAIVNEELNNRYNLPPLDMGVGIAISKAIVLLVGLKDNEHPKVIGDCVYSATKLASGKNKIYTDKFIENMWPISPTGKVKFTKTNVNGHEAYELAY